MCFPHFSAYLWIKQFENINCETVIKFHSSWWDFTLLLFVSATVLVSMRIFLYVFQINASWKALYVKSMYAYGYIGWFFVECLFVRCIYLIFSSVFRGLVVTNDRKFKKVWNYPQCCQIESFDFAFYYTERHSPFDNVLLIKWIINLWVDIVLWIETTRNLSLTCY